MQKEVLNFYSSLRQIFTVCPSCGEIHRLSDCKLYQRLKPAVDWKEKLDNKIARLEIWEEKLIEKIENAREEARATGRRNANKIIKKIDPIFYPLGLDCNDCKVIFHPVDFIVFKGMNNKIGDCSVQEILLLDKDNKSGEYLSVQKSVEKAVQKENYEWLTLRVENDGTMIEE
jgi:predicted Holliday junction resolvase-like endonuclease